MLRYILGALLAVSAFGQNYPAVSPPCLLGTYTVKTLPTNPNVGCVATVTDGAPGAMCSTGGGVVSGWCRFGGSGVGWVTSNGPDPSAFTSSLTVQGLSWPVVTITPAGTTGATSYTYVVVGTDSGGKTRAVTGSTTTGNATLSTGSYNAVVVASWSATSPYVAPVGACSVYRSVGGATQGVVGTIASCAAGGSLNDTGLVADGTSALSDTSGNVAVAGNQTVTGTATFASSVSVGNRVLPDNIVDVRAKGAKCDGSTDDNVALTAALATVSIGGGIYFPGICATSVTFSLAGKTHISLFGTEMESSGIKYTGSGDAAVDMRASTYISIRDMSISATNSGSPPKTVVVIGRTSGVGGGGHLFLNFTILGYSTLATLYQVANETTSFFHGYVRNQRVATLYAMYIAQEDVLGLGSLDTSSSLTQWYKDVSFISVATGATSAVIYIDGKVSVGDISLKDGFISASGGAAINIHTNGVSFDAANGPYLIDGMRIESSGVSGIRFSGSGNIFSTSLTNNSFPSGATYSMDYTDGPLAYGLKMYNNTGGNGAVIYRTERSYIAESYPIQFDNTARESELISLASPYPFTFSSDLGGSYWWDASTRSSKYYGATISNTLGTITNCSSTASPAVCGSAAAGSAVVAAAATSVVVNTSAVTANSQIGITRDDTLGTKLSVTCNTQSSLVLGTPRVTARTAGVSFTVSVEVGPTTNPLCFGYTLTN